MGDFDTVQDSIISREGIPSRVHSPFARQVISGYTCDGATTMTTWGFC